LIDEQANVAGGIPRGPAGLSDGRASSYIEQAYYDFDIARV
jgi:hypothetical protein